MTTKKTQTIVTTFDKIPDWWEFEHHGLRYNREPQACAFTNQRVLDRDYDGPMWNATLRTPSFKDQRRFHFYPKAPVVLRVPQPRH